MLSIRDNICRSEEFWVKYTSASSSSTLSYSLEVRYIPDLKILEKVNLWDYLREKSEVVISTFLTDLLQKMDPKYIEVKLVLGQEVLFKNYGKEGWEEFANYRLAEVLV